MIVEIKDLWKRYPRHLGASRDLAGRGAWTDPRRAG